MNKKIQKSLLFLLSILLTFLSFTVWRNVFTIDFSQARDVGNTNILFGIISLILESSVLKKIVKGKDLKTYFGLAFPFENQQIISILIGILIHYSTRDLVF